jgi:hypothetical protein
MNTIDLCYRPDTYWPDSLTPEQLLSRINGKARQDIARGVFETEGFAGLTAFLARAQLTDEDRVDWGRVHPQMMGGEYLPAVDEGEVEIARISMQSTTYDQISIRARREDGKIKYRVASEYEDDGMVYELPFEESGEPLTLRELMDFIEGATQSGDAYAGGILSSSWAMMHEFSTDEGEIVGFLSLSSPFYPGLASYYYQMAESWLEEHREEEELE